MAIKTKKYKSGEKKVNKKKVTQLGGRLNRAARSINRGEADMITAGVHEAVPRSQRIQKEKVQKITEQRRRRRAGLRDQ